MQDYIEFAEKNGITLLDSGPCQFCGANTRRGIHECLGVFNLSFENTDFSDVKGHIYRFLIVDAHALQHPEIHGRWSNHFHLSRLHLIFRYKTLWSYQLSSRLSDHLNVYKLHHQDEYLTPPPVLMRGEICSMDILTKSDQEEECNNWIRRWARDVYDHWSHCHKIVDHIAKLFLNESKDGRYFG